MKIVLIIAVYLVIGLLAVGLLSVLCEIADDSLNEDALIIVEMLRLSIVALELVVSRDTPRLFRLALMAVWLVWPISLVIGVRELRHYDDHKDQYAEILRKLEDEDL